MCLSFLIIDSVIFTSHILLNLIPLNSWAQGNVPLMAYSYYTFYMSLFCMMLMIGSPTYMMASRGFRSFIFTCALGSVIVFNASILTMVLKWYKGISGRESFVSIIQLYMILEQVAAFVPSMYIVIFDGLAFSPYALFNANFGNWDNVDNLPGQEGTVDDWMNGDYSNTI